MSVSRRLLHLLLDFAVLSSLLYRGSLAAAPICHRLQVEGVVVDALRSQCPVWFERVFPEEVDGDTLDKELTHVQDGEYYSIFFYASWCPFSQRIRPIFDTVSSMYPQIRHLLVEEHSAMPSVLSRYGIHSFPTMLLANRTTTIKYQSPKDFDSFLHFYRELTGKDPIAYFSVDQTKDDIAAPPAWRGPVREFMKNDPYVAFSLLFIILRAFTHFFPKVISQLDAFRVFYAQYHANRGIFNGLSQLLGRVVHVIDLKSAWNKLGLSSKTRKFRNGAKSARVWASSLASVSLGESSRPALSGS